MLRGLLRARQAIFFNTSNTFNTSPKTEQASSALPLQILRENCIFGLCEVQDVILKTHHVVVTIVKEQRTAWLDDVLEAIGEGSPG